MRVCDITKSEPVAVRYVIHSVPLDWSEDTLPTGDGVRKVHDMEVGESAATAIEGKQWNELHRLTPATERPKNTARSDAAKRAGETRRKNKEAKAAEPETVED